MNEIERYVLETIGENTDSPDVFTDDAEGMAQIRDSINDAIEEITMLTGGHKGTYYVPLISEQGLYRLKFTSGSFGWITDAWLVNQKRRLEQTDITRLNHYNPRWLMDRGSPESYFQVGSDILGVYRRPTGNDDLLEITAVVIPARYESDTDRVTLIESYKWAAMHYAVSEYWASRGDAKSALDSFFSYMDAVGLNKNYPASAERFRQFKTRKEIYPVVTK